MNPFLHKDVISVQYKAERLISVIDLVEAMVEYVCHYHLIKPRENKWSFTLVCHTLSHVNNIKSVRVLGSLVICSVPFHCLRNMQKMALNSDYHSYREVAVRVSRPLTFSAEMLVA